jgi:hypothetical protein
MLPLRQPCPTGLAELLALPATWTAIINLEI